MAKWEVRACLISLTFLLVSLCSGVVNAVPPVVVGSLSITVEEDTLEANDVVALFDDVDLPGDVLSYSVVSINNTAVLTANAAGGTLIYTLVEHAYDESGDMVVRATDSSGDFVDATIGFNVTPVNDLPTIATSLPTQQVNEDDDPFVLSVAGVFVDPDIATGDTLTYSLAAQPGFGGVFSGFSVTGTEVSISLAPDQHGIGRLDLTATDNDGASVTDVIVIDVQAVNDLPIVDGTIANKTFFEDEVLGPITTDAFDDVDILTDGDVLTLFVSSNDNSGLFDAISFTGEDMNIVLATHQFGTANIEVSAYDASGSPATPQAGPVAFSVTVDSRNDLVTAVDDGLAEASFVAPYNEDGDQLVFDVLANDDIPDGPGTIVAVGDAGVYYYIDGNGDTQTEVIADIVNTGTTILVTPAENYWGPVTFSYTVQDQDVDVDDGMVSFTVESINDAPEAINVHDFTTFESATLVVPASGGLAVGAYDVDPARVDEAGNALETQNLTVVFASFPPSAEGALITSADDGSFTFQPALGFVGATSFTYAIFDSTVLSETGTVNIEVLALPEAAEPPNPGEVSVTYNLANNPLEQSATVEPNVLVSMDDSGSMDWNFSLNLDDQQGRFPITNSSIATRYVRSRVYTYLWNLPTNTYSIWSGCCGRILPTEDSLPSGNDYQVWRGRNAAFNKIYYNPSVNYNPWKGLDPYNNDFADADPENIRLDPTSTSNLFNILDPHSYTASRVPNWSSGGGNSNVSVSNSYIPTYYEDDGALVEIRAENEPFSGGTAREDCAVATACSYDEEIQNFANWFQYYRNRGHVAKAAVGAVIADLQDIRVGYETINRNEDEPVAELNEYYWEGEKEELLDTVYKVDNVGGTPLRRALDDAGRILSCNFSGKPCPALAAPEGVCQQNYALLFTDGYWNGSASRTGNYDVDGADGWDGGRYEDDFSSTVADVAMYYYENDMFPLVDDGVPVTSADVTGVQDGFFDSDASVMHQHMKTFTIAFGVEGSIDADTAYATDPQGTIAWGNPINSPEAKTDDMLHAALNGRGRFLNAGDPAELQTAIETAFLDFTQAASSTSAAAFNSTSLREGTLLYRGFYNLGNRTGELTATQVSTEGVLAAVPSWSASELLDPSHVSGLGLQPSERIIVSFDPSTNDGIAFDYANLTTDQKSTLSSSELSYLRGVRTAEQPSGALRTRLDNGGLLGDIVNSSPVFVGSPRATNRDQSPYPTSELYTDFVNDYDDRTAMIYVGANDGMLHGFDATNGQELFAYVPSLVIDATERFNNQLDNFTSSFYLHDYYVDLAPRLNDVYMHPEGVGGKDWLTVLVGGLGAGGKGFFALDVTDPSLLFASEGSARNAVLWEFGHDDDTYPLDTNGNPLGGAIGAITDPTGQPVKDLGYSISLPSIAMSNVKDTDTEQEWIAIFGNGPNSTSGIATLFVLFMDKGRDGWGSGDFTKVSTGFGVPLPGEGLAGYPNGLGSPTAVDVDLNGTTDYVYAGDQLGNLWRFDLTSTNASNWEAVRLFQALNDNPSIATIQPILSRPLVTKHPTQAGFLITFGTGSFITNEDGGNTDIQSIYTIWDELGTNPPTANANTKDLRLVEQTLTNVVDDSSGSIQTRRILTSNAVEYASETGSPGTYGWYIDLDVERATETTSGATNSDTAGNAPPQAQYPGEKAIRRFLYRDGAILTTTVLPGIDETSCFGARPGAILVMDGLTGGDPDEPIIDFNTDTYIDEADLLTVDGQSYSGGLLFDYTDLNGALVDLSTLGGQGDTDFLFVSGGNDTVSYRIRDLNDAKTGRLSWTQLQE